MNLGKFPADRLAGFAWKHTGFWTPSKKIICSHSVSKCTVCSKMPGSDESQRPGQSWRETQLDAFFSSQKEASSREAQGSLCRSPRVYIKSHRLGNENVEMQIPRARGPPTVI